MDRAVEVVMSRVRGAWGRWCAFAEGVELEPRATAVAISAVLLGLALLLLGW